ncbi:hypothetical protein M404DRAFT_894220 [Pisolithus tinctorius Marx 270]|uniref:Uncharacterized protein n=1 Tax=Pisolithus tinctorius Marx 270 TaxID=870435 RepID=A0A0C3IKG3_PISTI|nr:hypothetical protein M404DRAFT_894220 [Pisolithus tinctorius Marx 270]
MYELQQWANFWPRPYLTPIQTWSTGTDPSIQLESRPGIKVNAKVFFFCTIKVERIIRKDMLANERIMMQLYWPNDQTPRRASSQAVGRVTMASLEAADLLRSKNARRLRKKTPQTGWKGRVPYSCSCPNVH